MKWMSGLTVEIEDLTRVVKRSNMLAFIPAPMFLATGGLFCRCRLRGRMAEMMRMVWGVDVFENGPVVCRIC